MTFSRLSPPQRTSAVATADVRKVVPGFSVDVLAVVAVVLAVTALVLAPAGRAGADTGPGGVDVPDSPIGTAGGKAPVTAADRDFVMRVRLAGLWEIPAGMMAAKKGVDPRVRQIGREIAAQHVRLNQLDDIAAARLGIEVPTRPTYEQRGWLAEMQRAQGTDFDHIFVERLRVAHGLIFSAIAAIRAGTQNDVVRRLAQEANQFVMTHMTLLESTHMVDYAHDVPTVPDPPPLHVDLPLPVQARTGTGGATPPVIWAVLALGLLAGLSSVARIIRPT
jgi:predicted outer membrane protein